MAMRMFTPPGRARVARGPSMLSRLVRGGAGLAASSTGRSAIRTAVDSARSAYKAYKRYQTRGGRSSGVVRGVTYTDGSSGEHSSVNYGYHKPFLPPSVIATMGMKIHTKQNAKRVECASGVQTYTGLQSSVTTTNYGQYPFSAEDVRELLTMYDDTAQFTNKLLLEKVTGYYSIANARNTNVVVTLYDCIARRDCSDDGNRNPHYSWTEGAEAQSGGSPLYGTSIGATPFQSEVFNKFWKCHQRTEFTLGAGQMHTHRFKYSPNRVVTRQGTPASLYAIQGLSFMTVIVIRGCPINGSGAGTNVTTSLGAVDVAGGLEYRFRQLLDNSAQYTNGNVTFPAISGTEQFINEDTGEVDAGHSA